MAESSKRVGGQYPRKRAAQACLVCRARKSRCDSQRPRCGFCASTNSECTYPVTESTSIDKASLMILERLQTMEDNMLKQITEATATRLPQTPASRLTVPINMPRTKSSYSWPNGDVIMTWGVFQYPATRCGQHRHWEAYRDELASNHDATTTDAPGPSPSIKAEFPRSDTISHSDMIASDDRSAQVSYPQSPRLAASLIRNYVVNIHSKSPILDLEFLQNLEERLLQRNILQDWSVQASLPAGFQPSDMAILLLVLALGEVSTRSSPEKASLGQSHYITLALPWLGLATFDNRSPIKDLQVHLLLASYHMWIVRPWEAWCYVQTAATKAEILLLRYAGVLQQKLSHRVLWAVAKMQLELAEEVYPHLNYVQTGRLAQLIQSTPIPPPPPQPFEWPSIGSHLDTDTWYYYLAETSSRRLVERIKTELYSERCSHTEELANIGASYPLACEFERQINEWMSSLPADLQIVSPPAFEDPLVAVDTLELSVKQRMQKVLSDRKGQLMMLVFRPFLAALADSECEVTEVEGNIEPLLNGTAKYLQHTMVFLSKQTGQPVRHYGCWLLARNVWSAALSLIAACHTPVVVRHMDEIGLGGQGFEEIVGVSPDTFGGAFCQRALSISQDACRLLRRWDSESPSLSFCADQLWVLIVDAQWHNSGSGEKVLL